MDQKEIAFYSSLFFTRHPARRDCGDDQEYHPCRHERRRSRRPSAGVILSRGRGMPILTPPPPFLIAVTPLNTTASFPAVEQLNIPARIPRFLRIVTSGILELREKRNNRARFGLRCRPGNAGFFRKGILPPH